MQKNTKPNKTSHIVTQRVYGVKPDTNVGKSLEPGLQSGTYSPPPLFPHHKNKKDAPQAKKRKQQAKKRKGKTTIPQTTEQHLSS